MELRLWFVLSLCWKPYYSKTYLDSDITIKCKSINVLRRVTQSAMIALSAMIACECTIHLISVFQHMLQYLFEPIITCIIIIFTQQLNKLPTVATYSTAFELPNSSLFSNFSRYDILTVSKLCMLRYVLWYITTHHALNYIWSQPTSTFHILRSDRKTLLTQSTEPELRTGWIAQTIKIHKPKKTPREIIALYLFDWHSSCNNKASRAVL